MAMHLTDKMVERLRVPKGEASFVTDRGTTGLALKVTPKGKRIWVMTLRYPGHAFQSARTLGDYPALSLADARAKAAKWHGWVRQGIDPAEAEAEERQKAEGERRARALKRANVFAAVAEKFISEKTGRRREADAAEIRRMLVKEWGDRPINEIAPRDVRALIDKIKIRAPYDARNCWGHAVGIFRHAVHEELIEASPMPSLDKKLVFRGAKLRHRDRYLNDAEIFAFWRATGRLGYPARDVLRFMLLTGVRSGEASGAAWSELHPALRKLIRDAAAKKQSIDWGAVDNAVKIWTVPAIRFKSDAENIVALPDAACAVVAALPRFRGCDYLFSTSGETPVWVGHKIKTRLDTLMLRTLRALARTRGEDSGSAKLPAWVFHDLRRTIRTNLSALKVEDHIAEMVLGHGRRGLQRVYDQHKFLGETRDAREAWAAKVRSIVTPTPPTPAEDARPGNVVQLRAV